MKRAWRYRPVIGCKYCDNNYVGNICWCQFFVIPLCLQIKSVIISQPMNVMKNVLFMAIIGIALMNVACKTSAPMKTDKFPMACGGYTDYRSLTNDDKALFDSVYNEEPKLTPYCVATQVVAGTNYRFLCRDKAKKDYVITVFVPLPCYANQYPRVTDRKFPIPQNIIGKYTVRRIDDIILTEDSVDYPTITFLKNGMVSASAGCNGLSGNYTYENGKLALEGMRQTKMFCGNEQIMQNERWLAETLSGTLEVSCSSMNTLVLQGKHTLTIAR